MAIQYTCKDGDMLDRICWKHYDRQSGAVEPVLAANPGLADHGPVLAAGQIINLPELPDSDTQSVVRLWD